MESLVYILILYLAFIVIGIVLSPFIRLLPDLIEESPIISAIVCVIIIGILIWQHKNLSPVGFIRYINLIIFIGVLIWSLIKIHEEYC